MDGTPDRPGLGRVVVGVDGSSSARTAALWAAKEAALRGSGLCLVHATDTDAAARILSPAEIVRVGRAGKEVLDRTAEVVAARHPDLVVVTEVSGGPPAEGLRRAAALSGTIVVGHRGRGGYTGMRVGSVVHGLLHRAGCPVITVPAE
ncbi:universal stress protein [Streptomyces sp. NPDC053541]|uniref:universal stress protein n=1 Tax=Streptomyces sp. NPDC053541 TaxID=3365709 RepID=UPI0037CE904E